jgi:hypothetical protein
VGDRDGLAQPVGQDGQAGDPQTVQASRHLARDAAADDGLLPTTPTSCCAP